MVFTTETVGVYCAVRTGYLNVSQVVSWYPKATLPCTVQWLSHHHVITLLPSKTLTGFSPLQSVCSLHVHFLLPVPALPEQSKSVTVEPYEALIPRTSPP